MWLCRDISYTPRVRCTAGDSSLRCGHESNDHINLRKLRVPTRGKKDGRDNDWSDDYSALSNVCIYNIRRYILYDLFFHLPALPLKKNKLSTAWTVTCLDSPILGEVGPSNFGLTWLIILQLFKAGWSMVHVKLEPIEKLEAVSWHVRIAMEQNDLKGLIELHDPFLLHCQCHLPNTNFGLITKIWMQIPSNTQKQNHTAARQRIPSSSSTQTL